MEEERRAKARLDELMASLGPTALETLEAQVDYALVLERQGAVDAARSLLDQVRRLKCSLPHHGFRGIADFAFSGG